MLVRKTPVVVFFLTKFSTHTPASSYYSGKWRNLMAQNQIVSRVSSLLLQRENPFPLIQKLNLNSKLTPPIFHQILDQLQQHPQISLNFFNWAKTNLSHKPDFKSYCKLAQILLLDPQFIKPAQSLFSSMILESESVGRKGVVVLDSMMEPFEKDRNKTQSQSRSLMLCSFVLECYSNRGLVSDGLEIFFRVTSYYKLYHPSLTSCNALLHGLLEDQDISSIRMAWCFCASLVRRGVSTDYEYSRTWALLARLLCKQGKLENAVRLLNFTRDGVIYNLVIDCYCKMGDIRAAVEHLNRMSSCKDFAPGFRIHSLVLDTACKCEEVAVAEALMRDMVVKGLLPAFPLMDYNPILQKLCQFGRSYAAEMLFEKALKEKIGLPDASYESMLKVLCKQERVKEAIWVYELIEEKNISLNHMSYSAFADAICKEEPSEQVDKLLKDVIKMGFVPHGAALSKHIALHSKHGRWKEAEGLLNVVLDKGTLPDSFCCSTLVEHYCSNGQTDKALELNAKIEKIGGVLDVTTYNLLLSALFSETKSGEAIRVFDYMKSRNVVSSSGFTIMIFGLCDEMEMRKAMKVHDEMLKMQLKPDDATYKRLISKFS